MSRETLQFIGVTLVATPLMVFGLLGSSGDPSPRRAAATPRVESAPTSRDASPFLNDNWSQIPAFRGGPSFRTVEVHRSGNADLAERLDSIAIGIVENQR